MLKPVRRLFICLRSDGVAGEYRFLQVIPAQHLFINSQGYGLIVYNWIIKKSLKITVLY